MTDFTNIMSLCGFPPWCGNQPTQETKLCLKKLLKVTVRLDKGQSK